MERVSVKPEFVHVNGSVKLLRNTDSIFTETIDLYKLKPQNGERTVDAPLIISPPSLRLVSGQDQIAKVHIWLHPQEVTSENSQNSTGLYHKVKAGETLWDISRKYNVTVDRLKRLNKTSLKANIYPDQVLIIKP